MNNYHNISGVVNAEDVAGNNTFTFTVTNNGEKPVEFRIDLMNDAENVATAVSGVDAKWENGGSQYFRIEAGETKTISVTFSEAFGTVMLYIDSTIWEQTPTTVYSGDITLKDFKFTNVA